MPARPRKPAYGYEGEEYGPPHSQRRGDYPDLKSEEQFLEETQREKDKVNPTEELEPPARQHLIRHSNKGYKRY